MNTGIALDIRGSADEIGQLLARAGVATALQRLDHLRQGHPLAVQEALDRYVASENQQHLQTDEQAPTDTAITSVQATRQRVLQSAGPPRLPASAEMQSLDSTQQFHVYASIVATRGTALALDDLDRGNRVILGIRNETRTTVNQGRGDYDDRIVVLWKNPDATTGLAQFQATTEPTSQYDARAGFNPRPGPFERSGFRRAEGMDSNQDGIADLGRLAEGTIQMQAATHLTPSGRGATHFSLRPSPEAVESTPSGVQRDTNGDGWFDSADIRGVEPLNNTFKHHMGSRTNTDSAGCQTLPRQSPTGEEAYERYMEAVRGTEGQQRWQYVLTSSRPAQIRQHEITGNTIADIDRRQVDARVPGHPDHGLYLQIRQHVDGVELLRHNSDAVSLAILHAAKEKNWTSVDGIRTSHPLPNAPAAETIFLVRESGNDPADQRLGILASTLSASTVESSLDQLAAHAREPVGQPHGELEQHQSQSLAR